MDRRVSSERAWKSRATREASGRVRVAHVEYGADEEALVRDRKLFDVPGEGVERGTVEKILLDVSQGPDSAEATDITVRTDRQLSEFFRFLERSVPGGLGSVTSHAEIGRIIRPSAQ